MKTLKSLTLGLVLLFTVVAAKAADKYERFTKNYAISSYIDAMGHGKLNGLTEVLDSSVKFSMLRGTDVISYNKADMLGFMKTTEGVEQGCTVTTSEVQNNDDVTVVKVDMKYPTFTRSNYVTVANTGAGWKITNVYSVFK
jgi:hypothetical protein